MRIGEIKKKIEVVSNDQKHLVIESEPLYGGQAQRVKNYNQIITAINILSEQKWNDANIDEIKAIQDEFGLEMAVVDLPQEKFNQLVAYINIINQKLPVFLLMLETFTDEQEQQIINVKLPENISSLGDLTVLNNRLEKLFKEFGVDGSFEFKSFDKGTIWYEILITGVSTFPIFIGCLKVAQEYFKMKKEYFGSEKAKLDYKASLEKTNKVTEKELESYTNKRLELEIEKGVNKILGAIKNANGFTDSEISSKIIIATKDLIKELGKGVEFHLSLNPPKYANEDSGLLEINYKQIESSLSLKKEEEVKKIKASMPKERDKKE